MTPYAHPVQSLYHAQDIHGQYIYGYATPTSTKTETKSLDGVTRGGYSYIDSNGILQSVEYSADPIHGFRVAATNLPQDLPDVAYAKAKHLADFQAIKAQHLAHYSNPIAVPFAAVPQLPQAQFVPVPVQDLPEVVAARARHLAEYEAIKAQHLTQAHVVPVPIQELPEVTKARAEHLAAVEATKARNAAIIQAQYNSASLSPVPQQLSSYVVPVQAARIAVKPAIAVAKAPVVSYAPIFNPSHQRQAQSVYGQYSYGYAEPLSSKSETRTADGVTRGGYSYIDANGVLQTVHYIADPVNGFRVAATNLPVHHVGHAAAPIAKSAAAAVTNHGAGNLYSHTLHY